VLKIRLRENYCQSVCRESFFSFILRGKCIILYATIRLILLRFYLLDVYPLVIKLLLREEAVIDDAAVVSGRMMIPLPRPAFS